MLKTFSLLIAGMLLPVSSPTWGFYAHRKINRLAVFTLPPEMIAFYKANIHYIEEASVNPDRRRYAVEDEGARHYFDADHYGDSLLAGMPRKWEDAVQHFGEDSLQAHGILPWHLFTMYLRLRHAFLIRDPSQILKLSTEFGHYVADAHVPLHTTKNYNGQLTGQEGIHGFWESRLPELFSAEFDFLVGRASYIHDPRDAVWEVVMSTHRLAAEVLATEKALAAHFREKRYGFETRGNTTVKVYAYDYAAAYHRKLNGMVERQMRASIKMAGDVWYTAWIDAGQPDLTPLISHRPTEEELQHNRDTLLQWRSTLRRGHED